MLTQEALKELLSYDPETGIFHWIKKRRGSFCGSIAGTISHGYIIISINKKRYGAHRLAFLYMSGSMPSSHVDHVDRSPSNNKWTNLRLATRSENMRNASMSKNNTSGYKGVAWDAGRRKWLVAVGINGKSKFVGRYVCVHEAGIAARNARDAEGYSPGHGERRE